MTTLQEGSHGHEVEALQNALVAQGYYVGTVDGVYGARTAVAVGYFQSCNSLPIDGVAGPQTQGLLGVGHVAGSVEMTLPAPDAVAGESYALTVNASHDTELRIVVWFTAGSNQLHVETPISAHAGSTATATVQIPTEIHAHEGEVHVHALAFPHSGSEPLDQKTGSFWVNR